MSNVVQLALHCRDLMALASHSPEARTACREYALALWEAAWEAVAELDGQEAPEEASDG